MTLSKRLLPVLISSFALLGACSDSGNKTEDTMDAKIKLETDAQRAGYSLGAMAGRQFQRQGMEVDIDTLVAGVRDGYTKIDLEMTEEELAEAMQKMQSDMQAKQEAERNATADANRVASEAFLAENASKEGVQTTESGLQYKVLTAGEGAVPSAEDQVTVHYRGTLIDGTEFDSSIARGQPATFPVTGVIPGWVEALQMMPVGSKWELYIPSDLAYGPGGAGGRIGPNSALIFEVELIAIAGQE